MHNEGPASTRELSEEELMQTIISLQGGKTFGRAQDNKVIFVEDVPNQEKGHLNISRSHAEVFHVLTGDGETYLVEDRSENGTYVNDLRLTKQTKQVLQSGDLIKFGHKNGSAFQPGERALQAHADWTFLVETPSEKAAAMKQTSTIRIFPNSPIIEQVEEEKCDVPSQKEDTPVGRSTVVQQQEADSTNQEYLVEPQLFGTSSGHDVPSTSQSCETSNVDMRLMEISRVIVEQMEDCHFNAKLNITNAQGISPAVIETVRKIDLTRASTREEKIQTIFNEIKQAMTRQREHSPSNGVRRQTEDVAVVDADSSNDVPPVSSFPLGSNASAFHPPVIAESHPLVVPQPTNPVENDETFTTYLQNICVPQQFIDAFSEQRQMYPSLSLLSAARYFLLTMNNITAFNNYLNYALPQNGYNQPPYAAGGVIRSTNRVIRRDTPDENRHSASSGSTAHSRQRTSSEESEIDVVGTDEPRDRIAQHVLQIQEIIEMREQEDPDEQENDENAAPWSPNFPNGQEYETAENLSEGGTETPSPGPENGEPLQPINALAEQNIRDEEEVRREEPNSNSSSTLGTPIGSPVQSNPSNSPAPLVEDVVENAEVSEAVVVQEVEENRVEEPVEPAPERAAPEEAMEVMVENDKAKEEKKEEEERADEALRKKEEEARLRKERLKKKRLEAAEKRKLAAAEAEKKEQTEETEAVKEKKKTRETRKMKQLDSEESDSEADDAENQKRSVRRSTRGKPTTSVEEPVVQEENDEDDSDAPVVDSPESRKLKRKRKQTAKRVSVRKAPARKSQVEEEEVVVESAAEDEAASEEPKRKRGRKKESSAEISLDNPNHPKNLCGVTEEYCIASYIDLTPKGSGVQWVQCETKGCKQWFHSYCVCLDNMRFKKRKNAHLRFYCCGPKLSVEATEGRNGDVYRRFEETYEDEEEETEQAVEVGKATPARKTKQESKKSAR